MIYIIARKSLLSKLLGILFTLTLIAATVPVGLAQDSEAGWTFPQRIPGLLDDTFTPVLISDQNRTVHAFASQRVGENDEQFAIVYSKWTHESGWTTPVDVILFYNGDTTILDAYIDKADIVHIVFWGGKDESGSLYYSSAPIALANHATAWSEPKMLGYGIITPSSAALIGDGDGNLIAIYSGRLDGNGIYAIQSSDSGETWSQPRVIFINSDPKTIPYSIQMISDASGQIHATWNVVDSVGNDLSLHYAGYNPKDNTWSEPMQLEEKANQNEFFGPSFPAIADSNGEILVMYNSGNPYPNNYVGLGRPVQLSRISKDGGQNWSAPSLPFVQFQGRSGEHSLAVDSSGVAHALFIQRIDRTINGQYLPIGGIWHSEYSNSNWSEPERIPIPFAAHDVHTVVRQGNVLLAAWRADPGIGQKGIWYSFKDLGSPELLVKASDLNTPEPEFTPGNNEVPVITTSENQLLQEQVSTEWINQSSPGSQHSPIFIVMLGLGPVFLVLAGLILFRRFFH